MYKNYFYTIQVFTKQKILVPFLFLSLSCSTIFAQDSDFVERCNTAVLYQELLDNNPTFRDNRLAIQQHIEQYAQSERELTEVITIPVVFHVIHNGEAEGNYPNIDEDLICAQLDQLNDDFRAMNANIGDVPPEFQDDIGDMLIQFCFAAIDPDGNATNGIRRYDYNQNVYTRTDFDNTIKPQTIWDRDRYFNIWTAELSGGLLGYAQFPGGPADTDGIVNLASSIGSIAMPSTNGGVFNLGRTVTHEAGHFFDLFHIWGDDCPFGVFGSCNGSDQVSDTPNQLCPTAGCPTGTTPSSCGSNDMFQNYMDYTNDACMSMFSKGQVMRSQATVDVGGFRRPLATSTVPCTSCGPDDCPSNLMVNETPITEPLYSATNTITSAGTVASGSNVTFEAGQSITLKENFVAENGSTFTARIQACTSNLNNEIEERTQDIETVDALEVFPNPTSAITTVRLDIATS
ncbi:MAG: zinc metalloprotease, partial [Bacteroidota bacterium]